MDVLERLFTSSKTQRMTLTIDDYRDSVEDTLGSENDAGMERL